MPARPRTTTLYSVRFDDVGRARRRLEDIAGEETAAFSVVLPKITACLGLSARPDEALVNLRRYFKAVPDRAAEFDYLNIFPRAIEILVRLFDLSPHLTDVVIRHPHYLRRLTHEGTLLRQKSVAQLREEFRTARRVAEEAAAATGDARPARAVRLDAVRRYRRWETLRVGTADAFGLLDLRSVTNQLSDLAEAVVRHVLDDAADRLGADPSGLSVLAYGKLGGRELNYSSDIDLAFVCDHDAARFVPLAREAIADLTRASEFGFLYRVDMRLRPWGRAGELVSAVDAFARYLRRDAAPWELQALLKARLVAGDPGPAADLLERAEPLVYGFTRDAAVGVVRTAKRSIEEKLPHAGRGDVKGGVGSIRDIEFTTQALQLTHGRDDTDVRVPNTIAALDALMRVGRVTAEEHRVLVDAYDFLRATEHALQITHDTQTHRLPDDDAGVERLATRLRFADGAAFLEKYASHVAAVRDVFERHVGADPPPRPGPGERVGTATDHAIAIHPWRVADDYRGVFRGRDIALHVELLGRLSADRPVAVRPEPLDDGRWRLTVVGFDHVGGLTVVCGLLFCYGFDIADGEVFTEAPVGGRGGEFVNALTVRPPAHLPEVLPAVWERYEADLLGLARAVHEGRGAEAQAKLARRVAHALREYPDAGSSAPPPVTLEIEPAADGGTILHIRAEDTPGFLYELTNALALCGYGVRRVIVRTGDAEARDTLWIDDESDGPRVAEGSRRQLEAAVTLVKNFTHLLPRAPNPEAALLHFRELVADLFARDDWDEEVARLGRAEVLDAVARLLGTSDFLWEDFLKLRFDSFFPLLTDGGGLSPRPTRAGLDASLTAALREPLAAGDARAARRALNDFKDRAMFRADLRHILGQADDFRQFSAELSDIAEAVLAAAVSVAERSLAPRHGVPRGADGETTRLAILALGKCGGRELGYASDIELMAVFDEPGRTDGPEPLDNAAYFRRVVETFVDAIDARRDGMFRIDLRLRPHGAAGDVAFPRSAFRGYFMPGGAAWSYERQALVKLRPVAGDAALGAALSADRDEVLYNGVPFDAATLRATRQRQIRQLVAPGTFHAKLSPGALVDCEYLVQALQIGYGHRHAALRATNTRDAADALHDVGLLTASEHARLVEAYVFFRRLIDALRVVRGHAKDLTVPEVDGDDFDSLARRLGFDRDGRRGGGGPAGRLAEDLRRHAANVVGLNDRLLPSRSAADPAIAD